MKCSFRISTDDRGLMTVAISGLATLADFEQFEAQRTEALSPGIRLALIDISACNIQTREVAEKIGLKIEEDARFFRRVAIVTGASAVKMQVRRMSGGLENVQTFDDQASGEAWLFESASM